jgi:hypothetical protein
MIGAVKPTTIQKKEQLEIFNARLNDYFKQFKKLESIYEKTGKHSDETKLYLLEKKMYTLSDKIENLENSLPKFK